MKHKLKVVFAFIVCLSFSLAGAISSAATSDESNPFTATEIREGLLLVSGPAGNTLVSVTAEGLILVDGVPSEYADEYLDFIYQQTEKNEILALFNTRWHPQVTGLNSILGGQGVKIIAHENTKQWLGTTIRKRGDEIIHTPLELAALPNDTFYAEASFADINYGYLLQAHTDGDIYLSFSDANVLVTGGMVRSDGWPVLDIATGGFIGGMLDAYLVLLEHSDADTLIIPASGPVMNKAELQVQYNMYKAVLADLVESLRSSKSPAEAIAAEPTAGYYPQWGSPEHFLDQAFRSFYGHLRNGRHVGVMP